MTMGKAIRVVALALAGMGTQLVFAGSSVVVTYTPAVAGVPTLSEWTMLGLAGMLALVAYKFLRQRTNGQPLAALFLTVAVGAVASWGGYLGKQALATPAPDASMSLPGGGTVNLACSNSGNVVNATNVPLRIVSVTSGDSLLDANLGGTCKTLPVVQPSAFCTVTNFCTI